MKTRDKILDLIKNQRFTIKRARTMLGLSRTTIYKHLRALQKKGLVQRKERGVYILVDTQQPPLTSYYRFHSLMAYFELPTNMDLGKWGKNRGRFLTSKGIYYKKSSLGNDILYHFILQDRFKCFATSKGVMVYIPEIRNIDLDGVYHGLASSIEIVGNALNRLFGGSFYRKDRIWQVSLRRGELAHVRDGIGEKHKVDNDKLKVFLEGVERMRVDVSLGEPEVEFPSVGWQEHDARVLIETWYKDILREGALLMPPSRVRYELGITGQMFMEIQRQNRELLKTISFLQGVIMRHLSDHQK